MVLIVSGPKWSLDQTHHHITTWMLSSASRTLSLSRDQPFKEEQNLWQYLDLQRAADTVIQKHSNSYSVHGGNAHVMGELKTYVLHLHGPPYLRSTTAVFWFLALLLIVKAFHLCQWSTSGPTALTHTHFISLQSSGASCIIQHSPCSHALDLHGLQRASKATYFEAALQDQKSWGNWCFKTMPLR